MSTDDAGSVYTDSALSLTPPEEGNSLLRSYDYSRVEIARSTGVTKDGNPIYPWVTIVETYDTDDAQKERFFLLQTDEKIGLMVGDEKAGSIPAGIDQETGQSTTNVESFDPTQASDMFPAKLRRLEGNEYANLISIIIVCETDDR